MPHLPTLLDALLIDPLATLDRVDAAAAKQRRQRMAASPADFQRGALALHLRLVLDALGGEGPWVWANGDPHVGNFATLANGPRREGMPAPVVYDLADGDDEHPAPWTWDLCRLLTSLALARPDLDRADLRRIAGIALERYRDVLGRAAEDDAEHGGRIFLQDLPSPLLTLIERDADPAHAARWWRERASLGKRPRLRRTTEQVSTPDAEAVLTVLDRWQRGRLETVDCVRRVGNGLASLGRGRWLALARDGDGWRLLELKERRPSELAAVVLGHPFTPRIAETLHTVPHGRDPWHAVLAAAPWPLLVRTRDHARSVLDPREARGDDLRAMVKLWATLLASTHLAGTRPLVADFTTHAALVADDVGARAGAVASAAWTIAKGMREAHRLFRRRSR